MRTTESAIKRPSFAVFDRHAEVEGLKSISFDARECFGMLERIAERARAALEGIPERAIRPILMCGDVIIASWMESGGTVRADGERPFTAELARRIHPLDILGLVAKSLRLVPITLLGEKNGLAEDVEVTLERLCASFALTRLVEGARQLNEPSTAQAGAYNLMQAATAIGLIEAFSSIETGSLREEIETRVRSKNAATAGKGKAAKAQPNPEKQIALDLKRQNPVLSAKQIKARGKLRAGERTISGWVSAGY